MGGTSIDWSATKRHALRAHELLGASRADLDALPLRAVVRESWKRSLTSPVRMREPQVMTDGQLRLAREHSELQRIWPVFEQLLVPAATDANLVVALADAHGTLLWVAGSNTLRSGAERVGFAAGANWGEAAVGTSAPGLALVTGNGVQVSGAEHLSPDVHHLNCSAVPIRNPRTGRVIGAVDLTGGNDAIAVHSLPLLRAAVAAAESRLLLPGPAAAPGADFLDLCAGNGPELSGQPMSLRHAEILTLLAAHPRGLSNAQLVEELFEHPDASAAGTVRAELVRLRKVLAVREGRIIAARPYRLAWELETTASRMWQALQIGDLQRAMDSGHVEFLGRSLAPGIIRLRRRVQLDMCEMALDRGSAQQLLALGRALGDPRLLRAALRELPVDAPVRSLIVADVEALEA